MTKYISLVLVLLLLTACSKTKFETHDHSNGGHDAHDTHGHGGGEIENLRFTIFTKQLELFAEVTPFIKDNEGDFIIHYTKISDFKPITNGSLQILINGSIYETIKVDSIARAGIFTANYTPKSIGNIDITLVYTNSEISDTIVLPTQTCYSSLEEAKKYEIPAENGISFLKEEAWKIDFSLFEIKPTTFTETIKSVSKILNNPSDENFITATTSGVVEFVDNSLILGKKISAGTSLFKIKSASLREDNLELKYAQAKSNYDIAKKEYSRISELYKMKISSEKEYLDAKSLFENADAIFKNYSQSSEGKTIAVKTSKAGFLRKLYVNSGQFVEAGTTLAIVSNNNKLMIRVDLPSKDFYKIGTINDANFVIENKVYKLKELNGKSKGSPINTESSGFVSQFLEIDNLINLHPNSLVTTYILGGIKPNSISVPKESLWEDQSNYFVFVQKHGELYEKREVTIDGFDGFNYLIGSGLNFGEVIVSKGTYRVMLASKSSELPAQSHAH